MGGRVSDRSQWEQELRGELRIYSRVSPTFVARAFDRLQSRERALDGHALTDLVYVLGRYLVAASASVFELTQEEICEKLGKKAWSAALDNWAPILGLARDRATKSPRPPFTDKLLQKLIDVLGPLSEARNAESHRYECQVAQGPEVLEFLRLSSEVLKLRLIGVSGAPGRREGVGEWTVRIAQGVGQAQVRSEEISDPTTPQPPWGPCLVLNGAMVDLRPWVVKLTKDSTSEGLFVVGLLCPTPPGQPPCYHVEDVKAESGWCLADGDAANWRETRAFEVPEGFLARSCDRLASHDVRTLRDAGWEVVGDVVGEGGFGRVFRARRRDAPDEKLFAVKLLHTNTRLVEDVDSIKRRVQRLARRSIAGAVRYHPEHCRFDRTPHIIAMDFVEGRTLETWLAETRGVRADRRRKLALDLVRAAARLHGIGVVHRDLRPSNIIVTSAGEPVIIDLGLARLRIGPLTQASHTMGGLGLGVAPYAAPEQLRPDGAPARDPQLDVHALAHLVATIVTGEPRPEALDAEHPWGPLLEQAADEAPKTRPRDAIALLKGLERSAREVGETLPGAELLGETHWPGSPLRTVRLPGPHASTRAWQHTVTGAEGDRRDFVAAWVALCVASRSRFQPILTAAPDRGFVVVAAPNLRRRPLTEVVDRLGFRAFLTLVLDLIQIGSALAQSGAGLRVVESAIAVDEGSGHAWVVHPSDGTGGQRWLIAMWRRWLARLEDQPRPFETFDAPLSGAWGPLLVRRDLSELIGEAGRELERVEPCFRGRAPLRPGSDQTGDQSDEMTASDRDELQALLCRGALLAMEVCDTAEVEAWRDRRDAHEAAQDGEQRAHSARQELERADHDAAEERRVEDDRRWLRAQLESAERERAAHEAEDDQDTLQKRFDHEAELRRQLDELAPIPFVGEAFVRADFDEPSPPPDERASVQWTATVLPAHLGPAPALGGDQAVDPGFEPLTNRLEAAARGARDGVGDAWDRFERLQIVPQAIWCAIGAELDPGMKLESVNERIRGAQERGCDWRPFGTFELEHFGCSPARKVPWGVRRDDLGELIGDHRLVDLINDPSALGVDPAEAAEIEKHSLELLARCFTGFALGVRRESEWAAGAPLPVLRAADGKEWRLNPKLFTVVAPPARAGGRRGGRPGSWGRLLVEPRVGWPSRIDLGTDGAWVLRLHRPPSIVP